MKNQSKPQRYNQFELKENYLKDYKNPSEKKLVFNNKVLSGLTIKDRILFESFGQGITCKIPYQNIQHAFEHFAIKYPNAIAVTHANKSITYAELNSKANILARVLIKNGVVAGDHVGLYLERSIGMVIGILAILKAGAAYVPQHIKTAPKNQLRYISKTAKINIVLTTNNFKKVLSEILNNKIIIIDDQHQPILDNTNFKVTDTVNPDQTAFIIFTSGTTGNPNGVQVTHKNLCNILLSKPGNLSIKPGIKVSQILNIAFDMAAWEILGCLANGGTLVIREQDIQETVNKVHVVIATPTILSAIDTKKCPQVKMAAVAGEPCPKTLANKWSKFCTFYNSCGPTETTIINTAQHYNIENGILTIGSPTPNNTVYILDDELNPLPIGEIGEMWAGGDCVSKGYLNNEDLTNERYKPDPFIGNGKMMFRTRDLGRWTHDGQLEHFGRTDDQVKIRGFRVELDAVSAILETMNHCKRAATFKYDDKSLIAFVSPKTVTSVEAKTIVAQKLPYYCVPEHVVALETLPMTTRGKIDKQILKQYIQNKRKEIDKQTISETEENDSKKKYESHREIVLPKQKPYLSKIWDGPKLMHYNRLFIIVLLANLIYGLNNNTLWNLNTIVSIEATAKLALINFFIAIIIRQQLVINLLFKIATSIPKHWPLRIRRVAAKVYHFGGIHVGAAVTGTLWFLFMLIAITKQILSGTPLPLTFTISAYAILIVLIINISLAHPKIRARKHDLFEKSHRFGGWTVLLLFWINTLSYQKMTVNDQFLEALATSSSFWMLCIITLSIIFPWMFLKKVPVTIEKPSSHAVIAKFDYGVTPFAGSSTAISRNPLTEWHSFANIPSPSEDGFRLTISRAGDWTGKFIDDIPKKVWVKGIPTAGVGNIDKLFNKVLWVATGSGIGPCLPHMLTMNTPSQLVWATKNPEKTYGKTFVDEILKVQPNAIIWDTDANGKPDLLKLAYKAYKQFEAEAVICISNKKVTWHIVSEFESRNIPAYGAIWDS